MGVEEKIQNVKDGGYVVRIDKALEEDETNDRYSTGFKVFDDAMSEDGEKGGFRDGDLTVVSGKSSHGKTLFAQNMVRSFVEDGIPTLFFSYEVKINNVYQTFVDMGMDEKPVVYTPKKNISGNIDWIREKIDEATRKFGAKMIVIDHLDFITAEAKNDDFRRNEINNIVRSLKDLAVGESKVVILLAHSIKGRDTNLRNDDIADSRQINNLADYIFFVSRDMDEDGVFIGNTGQVKLTKSRHTGKCTKMYIEVVSKLIRRVPEPANTSSFKL